MGATIFYFSSTGNSLSLTRNLVNELSNCETVQIAKVVNNQTIKITTPRVGIIFPLYTWGIPRIIEEFVSKLSFSCKPYNLAVTTCVAIKGNTLKDLKNVFGSMFHSLAVKTFKNIDRTFVVEDSCNSCSNCANICPRSNIIIENGRPVFQHKCELCYSCLQWYTNFAIKQPNFYNSLKHYRNTAIRMNDIILVNH